MSPSTTNIYPGLITDADNTLWDTNCVYADAQRWLLEQSEIKAGAICKDPDRLGFLRRVDQAIAKRHHSGLRYPSHLLLSALVDVLLGRSVEESAGRSLMRIDTSANDITEEFDELLRKAPPLRDGVRAGLDMLLRANVPIVVATEGAADLCKNRLEHWELSRKVQSVVSAAKTPELFLRLSQLLKLTPERCLAVGDQLDRDVAPARAAGLKTAHFPGGFLPSWQSGIDVEPDFTVNSYEQVANLAIDGSTQASNMAT
jgi:putative hydrolase of the HAD superfamily